MENEETTEAWWGKVGLAMGGMADTPEKQARVKRLMYTWRDVFCSNLNEFGMTDLVEHTIDLHPNSNSVRAKSYRSYPDDIEFANKIFPAMEEAGIIARGVSEWAAVTRFPPKKDAKNPKAKRVVHRFIPINSATIKPSNTHM